MIKCPYCGKSHYREGMTTFTAMYFPPIWKDGVNVNPDGNIHTTECECLECGRWFHIVNGEVKECPQPYEAQEYTNYDFTERDLSFAEDITRNVIIQGNLFQNKPPYAMFNLDKTGDIIFVLNGKEVVLDKEKLMSFLLSLQK